MTDKEAREIIIEERDSLKANPIVKVEDCLYEAFDLAIKALEQTRWIPVSERLPKKGEIVLITNKWYEVDKALYIGDGMFDIIINYLQKEEVIAWMPLPQSYKAESED